MARGYTKIWLRGEVPYRPFRPQGRSTGKVSVGFVSGVCKDEAVLQRVVGSAEKDKTTRVRLMG